MIPLLGGVAGLILGPIDLHVEKSIVVPSSFRYSPATASTLLATIVGAMAALTGFVVTVSVLVVQMATGTFSARYMRLWYRDLVLKVLLGILVCTLTFSFNLLRNVTNTFVPDLGIAMASALVVVALLLFLVFLDRFVHRLRPVAVAALVGRGARETLEARAVPDSSAMPPALGLTTGRHADAVVRVPSGGVIQALDTDGLIRWARQHDALVALKYAVGDFVPSRGVLLEAFGVREQPPAEPLLGMVALGTERTIEQDPAFAVRILVDIAIKALSPAVNDPTTAVQALDHLEELLGLIGSHDLEREAEHVDRDGIVRLVVPHRGWEEYLSLAVTEIREYGAGAVQVTRRLRAVLDELHDSVREEHRPAVEAELARLDSTVARTFGDSVDLDLATTSDRQGIGGPRAAALPAATIT